MKMWPLIIALTFFVVSIPLILLSPYSDWLKGGLVFMCIACFLFLSMAATAMHIDKKAERERMNSRGGEA